VTPTIPKLLAWSFIVVGVLFIVQTICAYLLGLVLGAAVLGLLAAIDIVIGVYHISGRTGQQ
jgi:hypothetical protein